MVTGPLIGSSDTVDSGCGDMGIGAPRQPSRETRQPLTSAQAVRGCRRCSLRGLLLAGSADDVGEGGVDGGGHEAELLLGDAGVNGERTAPLVVGVSQFLDGHVE